MIAYLISELDVRGGTHKQFVKLLEYTDKQGVDFYIITKRVDFEKTYPILKKFKGKIRIFEQKKGANPISKILSLKENIRRLRYLLKDADIANIHDGGFELYLEAFKDIPTVWQINDLPAQFRVGVASNDCETLKSKVIRHIIFSGLKKIDKITVNVSKNAERVRDRFKLKAEVLYCGIEPIGIRNNPTKSIQRFQNNKINLLSSGVWFTYRNYETQVEVVRILKDKGYNVNLNIIGTTAYTPEYEKRIREMINRYKLNDSISICGMVDENQFVSLHKNSDIFLFINIDQSWGLAVFEAMSCGIPVIVSNSVGATEILHDNVDSLFVDPKSAEAIADSIINLTKSPEKYLALSKASSEFHTQYTWDNSYCKPMLNILNSYK